MFKKLTGAIALICIGVGVNAQLNEEVLVPLTANPTLKQQLQHKNSTFIRKSGITDTLLLPFFEDFSKGEVFPDENRWTNRLAYINTDFPVKAPSIGVATLDALDSTGRPYLNIRADLHGPCDTLTSQPIDISAYSSGNNIYLSFFYQAQGLSFQPLQGKDSLILQFKNNLGFWYTVWSTPGIALSNFKPAILKLEAPEYFHAGFQFRFINYQSYIGGVGQWHLDYIYMERNRTAADSVFADVAVSQKPMSFLSEYQEMPYDQFKTFESLEVTDSTRGYLSNLFDQGRTVDVFNRQVRDDAGNLVVNQPGSGFSIDPFSEKGFGFASNYNAVARTEDTVTFTAAEFLKITGANFRIANDSVTRKFTFANYYAYDDGSAETGYGLKRGSGKIAYRFRLNKPDSLRAISVYYFQAEDTIKRAFNLAVWQSITPNGSQEELLYTKLVNYPTYTDSINGYHTYVLDSAIAVKGEFYIGWVQTSTFHLNVGWDRNYTSYRKAIGNPGLYFNTTGKWYLSEIPGTLMMRPHVGKNFIKDTTLVGIKPITVKKSNVINVYPNPASTVITIDIAQQDIYTYTITDIAGKTINTGVINTFETNTLPISILPNGLYFLTLHNPSIGFNTTKFIKQ